MPVTTSPKRRLKAALALAGVYLVAEVIGGVWSGSLALLADAGHMLTDVGGLALALLAMSFAERPPTPERTYGFYRAEILAALTNAVLLIGISIYILWEAYQRFRHPPEVAGGMMLLVAVIGLLVNLAGLFILRSGAKGSLNVKGAYYEVVSDLLSSIGVTAAGVIIWRTGWVYADPIVSAGIGLFILPRTWRLMQEAIGILLEGTPKDLNLGELREVLCRLPGVVDVHDLHAWTLTSGVLAMSAHCVVPPGHDHASILTQARRLLSERFKIGHVTIQIEPTRCEGQEQHA